MRPSDDPSTGDEYGEAEINDHGQVTIPKALRDDLQIEAGTTFTVIREGADIRLVRQFPVGTLSTGKSTKEWEGAAFRDAGEATFGNR